MSLGFEKFWNMAKESSFVSSLSTNLLTVSTTSTRSLFGLMRLYFVGA